MNKFSGSKKAEIHRNSVHFGFFRVNNGSRNLVTTKNFYNREIT